MAIFTPPSRRAVLKGSGAAVLLSTASGSFPVGAPPPRAFPAAATVALQFEVPGPAPQAEAVADPATRSIS